MMRIQANGMPFQMLNHQIQKSGQKDIVIDGCLGQRYIGDGLSEQTITINGTPGNALGAYLNGATLIVNGNAQDATGDTMNAGEIIIHGNSGDATGYAMRGGMILVKGDVGYRAGIHMKQYQQRIPALVIGGRAGSFLGEYQAGGIILVLGIGCHGEVPVGNFCGTGMHGGVMYLRCDSAPQSLPKQVAASPATEADRTVIETYLDAYCQAFGTDKKALMSQSYFALRPDTKNPYKQLYTQN